MMKKQASRKVLVISAHPDDEVLGCGATIAKHVALGDHVWILILGKGVTSRKELSEIQKKRDLERLTKSAQKASKILGVKKLILKNFPDNRFDTVPLLNIIHEIEIVTDTFKPQIIYTHNQSDVNIDHRKTLQAVESVIRPLSNTQIEQVLAFEVPSSTEWNFVRKSFRPNVFSQINEKNFDKKIMALKAYSAELRPFPHPRSPEYLRALVKLRGGQSGFPMAEAFELIYWRR